jgi:hypothetical protein
MRQLPHVGAVMVDLADLDAEDITATLRFAAADPG